MSDIMAADQRITLRIDASTKAKIDGLAYPRTMSLWVREAILEKLAREKRRRKPRTLMSVLLALLFCTPLWGQTPRARGVFEFSGGSATAVVVDGRKLLVTAAHGPRPAVVDLWGRPVPRIAVDQEADLAVYDPGLADDQPAYRIRPTRARTGERVWMGGYRSTGWEATSGAVVSSGGGLLRFTGTGGPGQSGGPVTDADGLLVGIFVGQELDRPGGRPVGNLVAATNTDLCRLLSEVTREEPFRLVQCPPGGCGPGGCPMPRDGVSGMGGLPQTWEGPQMLRVQPPATTRPRLSSPPVPVQPPPIVGLPHHVLPPTNDGLTDDQQYLTPAHAREWEARHEALSIRLDELWAKCKPADSDSETPFEPAEPGLPEQRVKEIIKEQLAAAGFTAVFEGGNNPETEPEQRVMVKLGGELPIPAMRDRSRYIDLATGEELGPAQGDVSPLGGSIKRVFNYYEGRLVPPNFLPPDESVLAP